MARRCVVLPSAPLSAPVGIEGALMGGRHVMQREATTGIEPV
jgi:hypothetical protein